MTVWLTIRTDKPDAEVGVYDTTGKQLGYRVWYAHRELSNTLLTVIREELAKQATTFQNLGGVLVFQGPGSFTGLRIGITVANTLAYGLNIPIVGITDEHDWLERGIQRLVQGDDDQLVIPEYGAEAHITKQKK